MIRSIKIGDDIVSNDVPDEYLQYLKDSAGYANHTIYKITCPTGQHSYVIYTSDGVPIYEFHTMKGLADYIASPPKNDDSLSSLFA